MSARVQKPAPAFAGTAVRDGEFVEVSNKDYAGKWLVLFFYPLDFTFVCPTEILAFNAAISKFSAINTEILGVSTDSEFSHLAWANLPRNQGGLGPDLKLTLLADKTHKVARDYGVLLEEDGVALRGLFLIDPTGTLRQITINDLPVGRSVEETLRLVQAFQFTDEHGEVCPANWNPDDNSSTIKPGVASSKEYFSAQNPTSRPPATNGKRKVSGEGAASEADSKKLRAA